jgi:hypothetical protein
MGMGRFPPANVSASSSAKDMAGGSCTSNVHPRPRPHGPRSPPDTQQRNSVGCWAANPIQHDFFTLAPRVRDNQRARASSRRRRPSKSLEATAKRRTAGSA